MTTRSEHAHKKAIARSAHLYTLHVVLVHCHHHPSSHSPSLYVLVLFSSSCSIVWLSVVFVVWCGVRLRCGFVDSPAAAERHQHWEQHTHSHLREQQHKHTHKERSMYQGEAHESVCMLCLCVCVWPGIMCQSCAGASAGMRVAVWRGVFCVVPCCCLYCSLLSPCVCWYVSSACCLYCLYSCCCCWW